MVRGGTHQQCRVVVKGAASSRSECLPHAGREEVRYARIEDAPHYCYRRHVSPDHIPCVTPGNQPRKIISERIGFGSVLHAYEAGIYWRVGAVTADLAIADEAITLARTDEDVLETAVREHARLVYRIAYSVLRNAAEAEDVVQEVFLRALRYGKKLREVDDPKAWLARIAWRVAVEERRRGMRDAGGQGMGNARNAESPEGDALHSTDSGAELTLLGKERGELLHAMISGLPDSLRDPLVLSAFDELSPREVGTMLGISEAAVRSRAFRARQILRQRMTARMGVGK